MHTQTHVNTDTSWRFCLPQAWSLSASLGHQLNSAGWSIIISTAYPGQRRKVGWVAGAGEGEARALSTYGTEEPDLGSIRTKGRSSLLPLLAPPPVGVGRVE